MLGCADYMAFGAHCWTAFWLQLAQALHCVHTILILHQQSMTEANELLWTPFTVHGGQ
jgi:hypothetical protein